MKKIILYQYAILITAFCAIIHASPSQQNADEAIISLLHNNTPSNMQTRLSNFSQAFLGRPYLIGALGEGENGQYNQLPLYRVDVFDCETYIDTVLALTIAQDFTAFKQLINHIRYKDSQVDFLSRNRFVSVDWNNNNQRAGFIKDITHSIQNEQHQPIVLFTHTLINKPSWYQHMNSQAIQIPNLSEVEKEKRLASLKQKGQHITPLISTLPYIPLSALFTQEGKPRNEIFAQIPNGSIIEIVRPQWDKRKEIGTYLDISHMGFVFWVNGELIFRQASSLQHKIIDVPLIDYLQSARAIPTIKGINIQVVNDV